MKSFRYGEASRWHTKERHDIEREHVEEFVGNGGGEVDTAPGTQLVRGR